MKVKFAYLYFALASVAAIAFRLFLLIFSIDSESGFIKLGYSGISIFMLISIAFAVGLIFVFSYKTKNDFINPRFPSIFNKAASFCLGISILLEILLSPLRNMLPVTHAQIDMILGILAFAVLILSAFKKELGIKFSPLFTVIILIFFIFRLICIFTIFSAFSMIVDIVFELSALCAMVIGFLFYSKCESLDEEDVNLSLSFASLLFSSGLGFTASVPKILLNLTGNSELIHINGIPMYSVFFASLFLLLYSIERFKAK